SLEEQALVDGCNKMGAFFRVTVPLRLAGLVAVLVFVFIWTWGDMLFRLILAKNIDKQTAALSLFTMMQSTRGATNYSGLLAAGVLFTLPAGVLFVLLQRPLLEGLRAGGVKGEMWAARRAPGPSGTRRGPCALVWAATAANSGSTPDRGFTAVPDAPSAVRSTYSRSAPTGWPDHWCAAGGLGSVATRISFRAELTATGCHSARGAPHWSSRA